MNYLFFTGIFFYMAGIFLERRIDAKGMQFINAQQAETLHTHFTVLRKRNSIANMILSIVYLALLFLTPFNPIILILGYVVFYLGIFFIAANYYIRELKKLDFPKPFIRNFVSAKFIRVLAFSTFIATIVGALKSDAF